MRSYDLVKDGKSDYRILLPAGEREDEFLSAAAEDLQFYFREATGVTLPIVTDDLPLRGGNLLSVGNTELVRAAGLMPSASAIGTGGAVLKTVGSCILMMGATNEGAMYAAYLFLEREFGFEYYFTDFYDLKRGVENFELPQLDLTVVPDFEYRVQSAGWIRYFDRNKKRMRWTESRDLFIPANGKDAAIHNSFAYFPPEVYKETHPEWYSDDGTQLCYSAHGDENGVTEMVNIVTDRIKTLFRDPRFSARRLISFSVQDTDTACTCPACTAAKEKYGSPSALVVKMCNRIARNVRAWQEGEGKPYARDFRLLFFAYHATNPAPVFTDEKDVFRVEDESVLVDENVAVYFAETGGDYHYDLSTEGTANTFVGDDLRAWAHLAKDIFFWSYSTNFFWFFTPYNSFDAVQSIYRFAKEQGCKYIMTQDQWIQANAQTGWGIFKNWLHGKLGWNVNADVPALTEKFFNGYFGPAAPVMRSLFENWLAWSRHQAEDLGYSGHYSIYKNPLDPALWPKEKLEEWLSLIGEAHDILQREKDALGERYKAFDDHVTLESIDYRYLMVELYGETFSSRQLFELKKNTLEDIRRFGMDRAGAKVGTVTDLSRIWGF